MASIRGIFGVFVVLYALLYVAEATHFRFSTISWQPSLSNSRTITFNINMIWRKGMTRGLGNSDGVGKLYYGNLNSTLAVAPSDDVVIPWTQCYDHPTITDLSWCAGTTTITKTFTGTFTSLKVFHTNKGRLVNSMNNNADMYWYISTVVNFGPVGPTGRINNSPVSNSLPIIPITCNFVNNFLVAAFDQDWEDRTALTYRLATQPEFCGQSPQDDICCPGSWWLGPTPHNCTHPPGLRVHANTGMITFDTRNITSCTGYWNTQVVISDLYSSVVVDFLMSMNPYDPTAPFFVSPPTPCQGCVLQAYVGQPWSAVVMGRSNMTGVTLTITNTALPTGMTIGPHVGANPSNRTLSWVPTAASVGVYVLTFSLQDSRGVFAPGQWSFVVQVSVPVCGVGSLLDPTCDPRVGKANGQPCDCKCPPNYSNTSYCQECATGYFGTTCQECPNCGNGKCIDGMAGTGQCLCNLGWTGIYCDTPVPSICSPNSASALTFAVAGTGSVTPSTAQVRLTAGTTFDYTTNVTVQIPAPQLDIMWLQDVSQTVTSAWLTAWSDALKINTFVNSMRALTSSLQLSVGSFTDRPATNANDFIFRLVQQMSPDAAQFTTAVQSILSPLTTNTGLGGNNATNSQLDSLASAAGAPGWRSGAVKIVIVSTYANFFEGGSYITRDTLRTALIRNNIIPVFFIPSATGLTYVSDAYTGLVTSLGFGSVFAATHTSTTPWLSQWSATTGTTLISTVRSAMLKVVTVVAQDTRNFVATVAAPITVSITGSTGSQVVRPTTTLQYLSALDGSIPDQPLVQLTYMGYGASSMTINVNRPPTPSGDVYSTWMYQEYNSTIKATDPDQNSLVVFFRSLPQQGPLFPSKALSSISTNAYVVGQSYLMAAVGADGFQRLPFFYVPTNPLWYGTDTFTYQLFDGCLLSPVQNATITVGFVNTPPTCIDVSVSVPMNGTGIVLLQGDDRDDGASKMTYRIASLPSTLVSVATGDNANPTAGTIVSLSVNGDDTITGPWLLFKALPNVRPGTTVFRYTVTDLNNAIVTCNVNVEITFVNTPPRAFANSITVDRLVPATIPLVTTDVDPNASFSWNVVSFNAGTSGILTNPSATPFSTGLTWTTTATSTATASNSSSTAVYTAPATAQGNNYAQFVFSTTDANGGTSNLVTVLISIKPSLAPIGNNQTLVLDQRASTNFTLTGRDPDWQDANSLQYSLASLPLNGQVVYAGTTTPVPTTAWFNNLTAISFIPNPTFFGSDSLSFTVRDQTGLTGTAYIAFTVRFVNLPPTAASAVYTGVQNQAPLPTPLIISDPDSLPGTLVGIVVSFAAGFSTLGSLQRISDSANVPANSVVSANSLQFRPNTNQWGSTWFFYVANDGAANSTVANITITIAHINQPPTPLPGAFSFARLFSTTNRPLSGLNVTDIDSPLNTISAVITSLPDSTLGVLYQADGVTPINIGDNVPAPRALVFQQAPNTYGTTSFTFRANDNDASNVNTFSAGSATVGITITYVNSAPVCSVAPASATITQSRAATVTLTASDLDFATQQVSFSVTSVAAGATIQLSTSTPYGAGTTISTATTVFSNVALSSSAAASVRLYFNANAAATSGTTGNFTFTVSDGTDVSTGCTFNLFITASAPPTAIAPPPKYVLQDNTTDTIVLNGTDTTSSSWNLDVVISAFPKEGSLYVDAAATIPVNASGVLPPGVNRVYYKPNAFYNGNDTFSFFVVNAAGVSSDPVDGFIIVIPVNIPPTAAGAAYTLNENDPPFDVLLSANDREDGASVQARIRTLPDSALGRLVRTSDGTPLAVGDVIASPRSVTFELVQYAFGSTSFNFQALDSGNLFSSDATVSFTVNPVNQAPVVTDQVYYMNEDDTPITITFTGTDIDGDLLTYRVYSLASPTSLGSVVALDGTTPVTAGTTGAQVKYASLPNQNGNATFTFIANDGTVDSNIATIYVVVWPQNDPPTASASTPVVATRLIPLSIEFNGADIDVGDSLTFEITSLNANGGSFTDKDGVTVLTSTSPLTSQTATVDSNGNVRANIYYSAPIEAQGSSWASVSFLVRDAAGAPSATVTVHIDISPNNPPVAQPTATKNVNMEAVTPAFPLWGTDPDLADQGHVSITISTLPQAGDLLYNNEPVELGFEYSNASLFTYAAPSDQFGTYTFQYFASDFLGLTSQKEVGTFVVAFVNHPPTASVGDAYTNEDTPVTIPLSLADPDVSLGVVQTLTAVIDSLPLVGTLVRCDTGVALAVGDVVADACVTYNPPLHVYGQPLASFSFHSNDGALTSATVVGNIYVAYVNNPPVADDQSVTTNEDTPVDIQLTASDPIDNEAITSYTIITLPVCGTLLDLNNQPITVGQTFTTGLVRYLPPADGNDINRRNNFGVDNQCGETFADGVPSGAYAVFEFTATDAGTPPLGSVPATVRVSVASVLDPPTYSGLEFLRTPQNTPLDIALSMALHEDTPNFVAIEIISTTDNGNLTEDVCVAIQCTRILITPTSATPYTIQNTQLNSVKYSPPLNQYGENFTTFHFRFVIWDASGQRVANDYQIIISVDHVNQPPQVVPRNFNVTTKVVCYENEPCVVVWNATDIDSAWANLTSGIVGYIPTSKGQLYTYVYGTASVTGSVIALTSSADGVGTTVGRADTVSSDGLWRVVYIGPKSAQVGFVIYAFDDEGLRSVAVSVQLVVRARNIPPTVSSVDCVYQNFSYSDDNTRDNTRIDVFVSGSSVNNTDNKANGGPKITFRVTVHEDSPTGPVVTDSAIKIQTLADNPKGLWNSACTYTAGVTECNMNLGRVQQFADRLVIRNLTNGNYSVQLYVNDNGNWADGNDADRAAAARDAEWWFCVQVSGTFVPADEAVPGKGGAPMTAIVGAASAAGAAGAAAAFAWLRKKKAPTDQFFGDDAFSSAGVLDNPMYEATEIMQENPMFKGDDDL